jgi:hypothetical protein
MQTHPHVSVLRALTVMTETFTGVELWEMLQFAPLMRVDMMPPPI